MIGLTVLFPVAQGVYEQGVVVEQREDGVVMVESEDGGRWMGGEWQLETEA